jgi:two-component system phosphate regulon sensor histidine kinase PhoR
LLSLSHIKLDEHSRPKDSVDLVSLLHRMTEMLSQKAENAGLVVNMQIEDSLPAVLGDEDQLFQVFQNLLENALKYGANGDHVDIVAKMSGPNRMTIDVIDYGPGIPDDHIPRLTERFYRVDTARSRELGGTGLGLAIVKHILNRHRGRLSITSTVGKGSCFSVSLETVHPS